MFSKQTCICLTHSVYTAQTQSVKKIRKRSHNQLSPLLCTNVKKCTSPQLVQHFVSWSNPVIHKAYVETQTRVMIGQKWVAPMWSKPELHIFNVTTACLCLSVPQVLKKRAEKGRTLFSFKCPLRLWTWTFKFEVVLFLPI